jgi:hypothetical protein
MMSGVAAEERAFHVRKSPRGVNDIVAMATAAVAHTPADCREAVSMAVTELCENLVKYVEGGGAGTLSVEDDHGTIRLRVINPNCSSSDASLVRETVERLKTTDARVLYRARLTELFANPSAPRARLGLLRVAFEGKFRLVANYRAPVLEIIAERSCESGPQA